MPPETAPDRLVRTLAARAAVPSLTEVRPLGRALQVDSFSTELEDKAWWCVLATSRAAGRRPPPRAAFVRTYRRAWSRFYLEAALMLAGRSPGVVLRDPVPHVLCAWHFPEYPRLASLRSGGFAFLVKRRAPWMGDGRFIFVDDPFSLRKVMTHLRDGGSVLVMVDHAFAMTRNYPIEFLGRPCATPMGVFEAVARSGVSIGLAVPNVRGELRIAAADPRSPAPRIARTVLDRLTSTILTSPGRWLLWPNLNHRWAECRGARQVIHHARPS